MKRDIGLLLVFVMLLSSQGYSRSVWISDSSGDDSIILEYDIESQLLVNSFSIPYISADGLTYDQNGYLWILAEKDRKLVKYSRTGTFEEEIPLSSDFPLSLEGLTLLGDSFIIASPGTDSYYKTDLSGQIIGIFPMGTRDYLGLAAGGGRLFAAGSDYLNELDIITLESISITSFPSFRSTGLAFDLEYLWVNQESSLQGFDVESITLQYSIPLPSGRFYEGICVELIPEPSTIFLLGLGGFFLMRRRQ